MAQHRASCCRCKWSIHGDGTAPGTTIRYVDPADGASHSEPFNDFERVDSSASAIAAQGLIRFGTYRGSAGGAHTAAGLTVARRLLGDDYLAARSDHQGSMAPPSMCSVDPVM